MNLLDKKTARKIISEHDIRNLAQLSHLLKDISGVFIEEMLEAERDEHLGYQKHQPTDAIKTNARNGHSSKTVRGIHGETEIKIPRDRNGSFEPVVVKKYQTDISEIEDKVISMYAKGMTTRDIASHLVDIYGASVSAGTISNITGRITPLVSEWRTRTLEEVYTIVYIDGIRYKVREDGKVKNKCVYGVMGINLSGHKDLLGLWIFETESASGWLKVFNDLKSRGVADILILTSDGLTGISDAIEASFPDTAYQGCVVHLIRNCVQYVSYQDRKAFCADLRAIYTATDEESAMLAFESFEAEWGQKYQLAVETWQRNWNRVATMYQFSPEIRRLIYTTNPIESFNRQLRKVTKNRGVFPDDDSVLKLLYLATQEIVKKWTMKIQKWHQILAQLAITFEERVTKYL